MSRKEQLYTGAIIVVLSIFIYLLFFSSRLPEYPQTRALRYSFTVKNPESIPVEYAGFWAYMPVKQTANQKRMAVKASHPYKLKKDMYGNERMYFMLGMMAPYATKVVTVDVEMLTTSEQNSMPIPEKVEYLQPQPFIESDTAEIKSLGKQLDAWSASSATENIYEWVSSNLTYAGYLADDMGARYALESKSGDCSEYAYLVTALSRAVGREARVMAGFVVQGRSLLHPAEYHNWSEVYFGGTWHLVDAQRGNLENNYADYISFRVVNRPMTGNSKNYESQRLFGSELPLLVKMNGRSAGR